MPEQQPSIGRIVHLRLSDECAETINKRRRNNPASGNIVIAGEIVPMLITERRTNGLVNGQAFLNGDDSLWCIGITMGDEPGQWFWPPRV